MNGVILVNKEKGFTSRDVVNIISKHFKTKAVGHTGTLDPMAEGVLVICIGKATKLVDLITSYDKEYVAEITLGITSDTLDSTGVITGEESIYKTEEEIKEALSSMVGTYMQEVPNYAAVKINGKKLYEYARENVDVVLPKRQVTVKSISLESAIDYSDSKTKFIFKTEVSKGTYIRSLIKDIATKLNTIGLMSSLTRTKQGNFLIEDTYTVDQIKNNEYKLYSIKDILKDKRQVIITEEIKDKVNNGNSIPDIYNNEVLFIDDDGNAIALYHSVEGIFKPLKMFKE